MRCGVAWLRAAADSRPAATRATSYKPAAERAAALGTPLRIGTNRVIMANRDGVKLYDWNKLTDRRSGYGWYTTRPRQRSRPTPPGPRHTHDGSSRFSPPAWRQRRSRVATRRARLQTARGSESPVPRTRAGITCPRSSPVSSRRGSPIATSTSRATARAASGADCTDAIRAAIAACSAAGGGRVVVPAGRFLTGAVHLKSNVNLHVRAARRSRSVTIPRTTCPRCSPASRARS